MNAPIAPKHILAVNLKYLGDIIVITPALKALRRAYPECRITYMVRTEYSGAVATCADIDDILPFDFSIRKLRGFARLKAELRWVRTLRRTAADTYIEFHPGDRYTLWGWLSGAKNRIGPGKQAFSYLLTHKVAVYEDSKSYLEYYLDIANAAGAPTVTRRTEFVPSESSRAQAAEFLGRHGITENLSIIAIHPGASEPSKIWSARNFGALVSRLALIPDVRVVLFRGPMEGEAIRSIESSAEVPVPVIDTRSDVGIMAAVMERSTLCLSNDSAARHLAAAVGTPTLTLFPEDKTETWHFYKECDGHHVIVGRRIIPSDGAVPYLGDITVDAVYNKLVALLAGRAGQ